MSYFIEYFVIYLTKLLQEVDIPLSISNGNGNRSEWSSIQGVIGQVFSNLKLRARLPLNCTPVSPITS